MYEWKWKSAIAECGLSSNWCVRISSRSPGCRPGVLACGFLYVIHINTTTPAAWSAALPESRPSPTSRGSLVARMRNPNPVARIYIIIFGKCIKNKNHYRNLNNQPHPFFFYLKFLNLNFMRNTVKFTCFEICPGLAHGPGIVSAQRWSV